VSRTDRRARRRPVDGQSSSANRPHQDGRRLTSATSTSDMAQLISGERRRVVVFYAGDWDPSGLYMQADTCVGSLTTE
jgi:hypothetical protein